MPAHHRDPPLVFHVRIEFGERMFVGNHLPATGKADEGAVVAPGLFLEFRAIEPLEKIAGNGAAAAGHAPGAADLNVIATSKIQLAGLLFAVEPPGTVEMRTARAVVVVGRKVFHRGNLTAQVRADGVHDVFADESTAIGDAIGELVALRVKQDANRFATARRENHGLGTDALLFACGLVNEEHAFGLALVIEYHFAGMRIWNDVQIARRERRRQMHRRALIVRLDTAAASARCRPKTGRTGDHGVGHNLLSFLVIWMKLRRNRFGIERSRQHRTMNRHHRNADFFARLLSHQVADAALRRRLQHAGR